VYVVVDDGLGEYVVPDPTELPPHAACEYHAIVREPEPPDAADVSVMDCPVSIVGAAGVIAPADSTGLIVIEVPAEHMTLGVVAESTTL